MLQVSKTSALITCTVLTVCFLSGCSGNQDPVGTISGQVTHKSAGFSECKVGIYCAESFLTLGSKVDDSGAFKIDSVPPGQYKVMVYPLNVETPDSGPDPPDTSPIPKRMRDRKRTKLSVEVIADEVSEINIELNKKSKKSK